MFTPVYSCLPMFTFVYLCLPLFSGVYIRLLLLLVWSRPFQVERVEGSGDTAIPNVCLALRSVCANQIAQATCCFPSHVIVIRLLSQWRQENNQIHGK